MIADNVHIMGLSADVWYDVLGSLGVVVYLFSYWAVVYGVMRPGNLLVRILRWAGAVALLIPLGMRWFLTEGMLLNLALCLIIGGLCMKFRR